MPATSEGCTTKEVTKNSNTADQPEDTKKSNIEDIATNPGLKKKVLLFTPLPMSQAWPAPTIRGWGKTYVNENTPCPCSASPLQPLHAHHIL